MSVVGAIMSMFIRFAIKLAKPLSYAPVLQAHSRMALFSNFMFCRIFNEVFSRDAELLSVGIFCSHSHRISVDEHVVIAGYRRYMFHTFKLFVCRIVHVVARQL